ncbi:MAG: AAA family ATPase, partial [Actinomycetota bacterium]
SSASFETNPADLHRATDAVLMALDTLAKQCPSVLFIATTNFPEAVDEALLSRADLVQLFSLPDRGARVSIIRDSLIAYAEAWDPLLALAAADDLIDELAGLSEGADGRTLRKLVVSSFTRREGTARDPATLTRGDLLTAFRGAGEPPGADGHGGPASSARRAYVTGDPSFTAQEGQ